MSIPGSMVARAPSVDRDRLSRRIWQRAALEALITGGAAAVTVPRLAAKLGVTKGSFYWHFDGIDELLTVALKDWERIFTDERLSAFAKVPPKKRLGPWLKEIEADHPAQRLHLAIASAAAHPVVGAAFRRVASKRIAFMTDTFAALGFKKADARSRARALHATYLGFLQLANHAPKSIGRTAKERATDAQRLFKLLTR